MFKHNYFPKHPNAKLLVASIPLCRKHTLITCGLISNNCSLHCSAIWVLLGKHYVIWQCWSKLLIPLLLPHAIHSKLPICWMHLSTPQRLLMKLIHLYNTSRTIAGSTKRAWSSATKLSLCAFTKHFWGFDIIIAVLITPHLSENHLLYTCHLYKSVLTIKNQIAWSNTTCPFFL